MICGAGNSVYRREKYLRGTPIALVDCDEESECLSDLARRSVIKRFKPGAPIVAPDDICFAVIVSGEIAESMEDDMPRRAGTL
jgi:hypothetical protein